jgi:hypothetical protein
MFERLQQRLPKVFSLKRSRFCSLEVRVPWEASLRSVIFGMISLSVVSLSTACANTGALGQARSLWRHGEPGALKRARKAAKVAPPEKAAAAARLVCDISFEFGHPEEALRDYEFYVKRLKRHDQTKLRSLSRIVFLDALNSWDLSRRCQAVQLLATLKQDFFVRSFLDRARLNAAPEVRACAILALKNGPAKAFNLALEKVDYDPDPQVRQAFAQVLGDRLNNAEPEGRREMIRRLELMLLGDRSRAVRVEALKQIARQGVANSRLRALWSQFDSGQKIDLASYISREGEHEIWSVLERDYPSSYLFQSVFGLHENSKHNRSVIPTLGTMIRHGSDRAFSALNNVLIHSKDLDLIVFALQAAARSESDRFVHSVEKWARSEDPEVMVAALNALQKLAPDSAESLARELVSNKNYLLVRAGALEVLDRLTHPDISTLRAYLERDPESFALVVCQAFERRASSAVSELTSLLHNQSDTVRHAAIESLANLSGPLAHNALTQCFKTASPELRRRLLPKLQGLNLKRFQNDYVKMLRDGDRGLDLNAAANLLSIEQGSSSGKLGAGS